MPRLESVFLATIKTAESALVAPLFAKNAKLELSEWLTSALRPASTKKDYSSKMLKDLLLLKTARSALLNAKLART